MCNTRVSSGAPLNVSQPRPRGSNAPNSPHPRGCFLGWRRLLEQHGRLTVAEGEAQALRDMTAKARARASADAADRQAAERLLQEERTAHQRTSAE